MAIPKGKRTKLNDSQPPTEVEQVRLICAVTKKPFEGYEGQQPISKEGWVKLKKRQKSKLAKGIPIEEVL